MSKQDTSAILSFNRQTGYYEGLLLVQVDAEIFRRLLLAAIEEDEVSDLTDTQTWASAVARIGEITRWLGKSHVKVTPVTKNPVSLPETVEDVQVEQPAQVPQRSDKYLTSRLPFSVIEADLRDNACHVPPHKWEERLLMPLVEGPKSSPEKKHLYYIRSDQRKVLTKLRKEWMDGRYIIDADAAEQEQLYEKEQQSKLMNRIEVVANTVKRVRLH